MRICLFRGLAPLGGCVDPFGRVPEGQRPHRWTRRGHFGGVVQVSERSGPNLVEKRQCENSQLNKIQFSSINTLPMKNILKLTVTSSAKMKT